MFGHCKRIKKESTKAEFGVFAVLRLERRNLCILGKGSTTELTHLYSHEMVFARQI